MNSRYPAGGVIFIPGIDSIRLYKPKFSAIFLVLGCIGNTNSTSPDISSIADMMSVKTDLSSTLDGLCRVTRT